MSFYQKLIEIIDEKRVFQDEPMKAHTTFRVGGPADYFVCPKCNSEVEKLVSLCQEVGMPYYILGNGSNLLVGDKGYRGVVIQIYKEMNDIQVQGEHIYMEAGALLSRIGSIALEAELTGFEFAAGIPGTMGGAVVMNAGAYGGEMKHIVKSVRLMDMDGNIVNFTNEQMEFDYRKSILSREEYVVLSAEIELEKGDYEEIKATMMHFTQQRVTKQPLSLPSAGSTF